MKIVILAGGMGTRLGAAAEGLPKSMVPIGDRPFLELVIESFTARGFRDFVLLTGYRGEVISQHFGDGRRYKARIAYRREPKPLGTGGAIRDAVHLLGDRFLVTYGDVLRRFDYDRFVRAHEEPCLAVYERLTAGNTEVEGGRVVRFDKRAPELPYIDAGFCVMDASALHFLPQDGACSFEEIVFPALARDRRLVSEIVDHNFYEIGTPEELEKTRRALA
ncbi:MAG TPA: sugar phosphate nucleotidyltransferase [Thermoanaerobaculia bacterium]|nr:sugar phosphate nucleotidyltransferase [Thermoanaerobaculia bacterium]